MSNVTIEKYERSIQLSDLARAVIVALKQGMPASLDAVETDYDAQDAEYASLMGISAFDLDLEDIKKFHAGHVEPLLNYEVSKDDVPYVAAFAYRSTPTATEFDHVTKSARRLEVICVVKADQAIDGISLQEQVYLRAERTCEAIHRVLSEDRRFGGASRRTFVDPEVTMSNSWRGGPDNSGIDMDWYWQGGRLVYNVEKTSRI